LALFSSSIVPMYYSIYLKERELQFSQATSRSLIWEKDHRTLQKSSLIYFLFPNLLRDIFMPFIQISTHVSLVQFQ